MERLVVTHERSREFDIARCKSIGLCVDVGKRVLIRVTERDISLLIAELKTKLCCGASDLWVGDFGGDIIGGAGGLALRYGHAAQLNALRERYITFDSCVALNVQLGLWIGCTHTKVVER